MKRLEFSKPVKIQMFRRAGGPDDLRCEGCGLRLMGKPFEYDHQVECWEMRARGPLTAEDGKLLCVPCHGVKSGKKAGERAHGKRIVEGAARAKIQSRPIPGSKRSGWKKPVQGPAERRS